MNYSSLTPLVTEKRRRPFPYQSVDDSYSADFFDYKISTNKMLICRLEPEIGKWVNPFIIGTYSLLIGDSVNDLLSCLDFCSEYFDIVSSNRTSCIHKIVFLGTKPQLPGSLVIGNRQQLSIVEVDPDNGERRDREDFEEIKERINTDLEKLKGEKEYLNSIRHDLIKDSKYANKYVAIINKKIVDIDDDDFVLDARVREKFGNEVILIERLDNEQEHKRKIARYPKKGIWNQSKK